MSPLACPSFRINAPNAGPMPARGTNPGSHRYRTITPEEPGQAGPPLPFFPLVARADAALRAGNKLRFTFFWHISSAQQHPLIVLTMRPSRNGLS